MGKRFGDWNLREKLVESRISRSIRYHSLSLTISKVSSREKIVLALILLPRDHLRSSDAEWREEIWAAKWKAEQEMRRDSLTSTAGQSDHT